MDVSKLKNAHVLITGGLGFIGSNLARRLVGFGARVTILDASLPDYGANKFNFEGIEKDVVFVQGDVRDEKIIKEAVVDKNYIFDLAAQASYLQSSQRPLLDLDINCKSKLILLEAIREHNPNTRIVFTSSRLVYGKIESIPISESHPTNPLSLYGIHKLTAEKYFSNYFQNFGIESVSVRIPNPYGPRQQVKHSNYGIVGWFIRKAIDNEAIQIFGDGGQVRDYLYIDDLTDALIAVLGIEKAVGQVYNLGSNQPMRFKEMAETIIKAAGQGTIEEVPWPENYEKNETGDYLADIRTITRDTDWKPQVSFGDGVQKTIAFYRENRERYW